MRTTLRIDDDLLRDLKRQAQKRRTSLTEVVNVVLRQGMKIAAGDVQPKQPFRQQTFSMGPPLVDLTKALALAADIEDEEIIRKLALGK